MKRVSVAWMGRHAAASQMGFSMGRFPAEWSPDLLTAVAVGADGDGAGLHHLDASARRQRLGAGCHAPLAGGDAGRDGTFAGRVLCLGARTRLRADVVGPRPVGGDGRGRGLRGRGGRGPVAGRARRGVPATAQTLLGDYAALARFKGQFQPDWQPRYLVVADRTALPNVFRALAYVHSYTGLSILKEAALALRPKKAA